MHNVPATIEFFEYENPKAQENLAGHEREDELSYTYLSSI